MNCKPGDLAIRVAAPKDPWIPVGSIVKVLSYAGNGVLSSKSVSRNVCDIWYVEFRGSTKNTTTGGFWCIADSDLRPIRDQDGEDEILRIAGYPHKETA